jgi:multiple sugar transport system substrate-binding protein
MRRTVGVRTKFLTIISATLVSGLLASCSQGAEAPTDADSAASEAAGSEPIELEFWSWVPNIDKAVDLWNQENPDVQVKYTSIAAADQAKLGAAVDAGKGPDVAQISQHMLPDFVISGRALDITEHVGDAEDQFTESSWGVSTFDEKVYAVPQDTGPLALFYRKDFFDEHGIEIPQTWEEYESAAQEVKAIDPEVSIAAFTPNEPSMWYSLLWQTGGSWFGIEGDTWQVSVNGSESQKLAEYWQGLLDEGALNTQQMWGPDYWAALNEGDVVTIPYAAWFAKVLETNAPDAAGKWAVAPLPRWEGEEASGDTGGAVNPVLKGTEHPKEAAEFALWLNTDPESLEILVGEGGLFPASKAGLELPALSAPSEYYGGQKIYEVFRSESEKVPSTWTEGPTFNQVTTDLTDSLGRVAAGKSTLTEELDVVQKKTLDRLADQGLNVEATD